MSKVLGLWYDLRMRIGIAILDPLFIWFCLWWLIDGNCVLMLVLLRWSCHSVVSTRVIFSFFGSFWSLLLGSSMAKKWPRPVEVLSCVVMNIWVRVLVIGAWAIVMVFFSLLSSCSDDEDIILLWGGVLSCSALGSSLSYICLLVLVFISLSSGLLVRTYETVIPALPGWRRYP